MIKKKCSYCKREIKRKFEYCPWCGNLVKEKKERDYGLLGEDDTAFFNNDFFPTNKIFEKVFSDINKLFLKNFEEEIPIKNIHIKFSTDISKNKELKNKNNPLVEKKVRREIIENKLPIVKAEAKFKRLPEGLVYEINVPGVKSKKDIVINKIENGIEIRAYSKDRCYIKTIPLKINGYDFFVKDEKIFFQIKN